MKYFPFVVVTMFSGLLVSAQNAAELVKQVKLKLDKVNDYQANAVMKIDVSFIKAPNSPVKVYYKKPDKFTVKKEGGISILPKGGFSLNLGSLLATSAYTVVPAGESVFNNEKIKIVKLLPVDENSDVVVITLYVDDGNLLIKRSVISTKEKGTYEMEMGYGKYGEWGLPDSVTFIFNTKDYKLPKGVSVDYENGAAKPKDTANENKKGKIIIAYKDYIINKGIPDSVFN